MAKGQPASFHWLELIKHHGSDLECCRRVEVGLTLAVSLAGDLWSSDMKLKTSSGPENVFKKEKRKKSLKFCKFFSIFSF